MPCYYTGSAEGDAKLAAQETHKKLTEVTRVACEALRMIEHMGDLGGLTAETRGWWIEHKKVDVERIAAEKRKTTKRKLQQSGLSKLTKEEKDALGLSEKRL